MKLKSVVLWMLFLVIHAHAEELYIGFHVANNQWGKKWVSTPLPEIGISFQYLALGMDGTLAGYSVYNPLTQGESDYLFRTRVSLYSMLQIPVRNLFFQLGYGVASNFRREERYCVIENEIPQYHFTSFENFHGEWRMAGGVRIPVSPHYALLLKGGMVQQEKHCRFFFGGIGIAIRPRNGSAPISMPSVPFSPLPEKSLSTRLHRIAVIGTRDQIQAEFNTAIELALLKANVEVVAWEKLRLAVEEKMLQEARKWDPKYPKSALPMDSLSETEIGIRAAQEIPLDGLIQTGIRYFYKTYGGDVLVQNAWVSIVDPQTGKILWIKDYQFENLVLERCKERVISDLLHAIEQIQ